MLKDLDHGYFHHPRSDDGSSHGEPGRVNNNILLAGYRGCGGGILPIKTSPGAAFNKLGIELTTIAAVAISPCKPPGITILTSGSPFSITSSRGSGRPTAISSSRV